MRELPPTAGMPLQLKDICAALFAAESAGWSVGSAKSAESNNLSALRTRSVAGKAELLALRKARSFEELLAEFLDFPEVDIHSSGTLCLSIAFEALKGCTGRTRVIIPAYSCPLVPIAIHAAGMETVLCDTMPGSCDLDISYLASICDDTIAAIVPTDLAGLPVDLVAIKKVAESVGAFIVEDAAQALGAKIGGRSVGASADIAIYSLAVGKGLSLFDGGILAVRDAELRQKVRELASKRVPKNSALKSLRIAQTLAMYLFYNPTGLTFLYGNELRHWLNKGDLVRAVGEHFDVDIPAYEFDQFRKRVGASALLRLPAFMADNRARGLARMNMLNDETGIKVLSECESAEGSWPFLMLVADDQNQRDSIMEVLWREGLGVTRLFIHDLASYDYLQNVVPQQRMPNAADFAQRSFTITNSKWLKDDEFEQIVQRIQKIQRTTQKNFKENTKQTAGARALSAVGNALQGES